MTIVLDNEIESKVQKLAEARHCTAQSIMTEAIRQFVEREKLWQDSLAAWQEYQEAGLHVTM